MCLFLICSCDNHDVEFNEKEQTFYIYNLLHFSIEPLDSFSKSYTEILAYKKTILSL